MKRFTAFFLLLVTFIQGGEIISLATAGPLIERELGENVCLVVELDNCFFESQEACGHPDWIHDRALDLEKAGLSRKEALEVVYPSWIEVQKVNHVQPVEEKFVSWILKLFEKNQPILFLTSRRPILSEVTQKQLKEMGVDLSQGIASWNLDPSLFSFPIAYEKGVLYAHDLNDKGRVLLSFLKTNGLQTRTILLISPYLTEIKEMNTIFSSENINLTPIRYNASSQKESIYSRVVADFQYSKLSQLLSQEEALLLIHHQHQVQP